MFSFCVSCFPFKGFFATIYTKNKCKVKKNNIPTDWQSETIILLSKTIFFVTKIINCYKI